MQCLVYLQERIIVGWMVRLAPMSKTMKGLFVFSTRVQALRVLDFTCPFFVGITFYSGIVSDLRCAGIGPCVRKYANKPSLGPSYAEVIGLWHIQGATLSEGCKSPDACRSLGTDIRGHARRHVRMVAGMHGHVQRHVRMWHVGLESWIRSRTLRCGTQELRMCV